MNWCCCLGRALTAEQVSAVPGLGSQRTESFCNCGRLLSYSKFNDNGRGKAEGVRVGREEQVVGCWSLERNFSLLHPFGFAACTRLGSMMHDDTTMSLIRSLDHVDLHTLGSIHPWFCCCDWPNDVNRQDSFEVDHDHYRSSFPNALTNSRMSFARPTRLAPTRRKEQDRPPKAPMVSRSHNVTS